jgi:CBS-domain-containing membrane protein
MLAGYTRQTYSLVVIMIETTQSINFFIPMMLTVLVSGGVGRIFNRSIYERALRAKQIPLLRNHVPKSQEETTAYQIMASPVLAVECIISVEFLVDILQKPFSSYPVLNSSGNIVGVITKNSLIVLIENHHWVDLAKLNAEQKDKLKKMY